MNTTTPQSTEHRAQSTEHDARAYIDRAERALEWDPSTLPQPEAIAYAGVMAQLAIAAAILTVADRTDDAAGHIAKVLDANL